MIKHFNGFYTSKNALIKKSCYTSKRFLKHHEDQSNPFSFKRGKTMCHITVYRDSKRKHRKKILRTCVIVNVLLLETFLYV